MSEKSMKYYYPNAVVMRKSNDIVPMRMTTYDSFSTADQAWKQVALWAKTYFVLCAWVTDEDNNAVDVRCYVDAVGNIHFKTNGVIEC